MGLTPSMNSRGIGLDPFDELPRNRAAVDQRWSPNPV